MLIERMIRAARLDIDLYEEAERDTTLTNQALQVVVLVAILGGIGAFLGALLATAFGQSPVGIGEAIVRLIVGILNAVITWAVWAFLTYFIGTRVFNGTATWGELLRTLGFSYSPGVLTFFIFIPCLGALLALAGWVWSVIAGVIAVRQALDFDTGKAILTVVISAIVAIIIYFIVFAVVAGIGALGSAVG